MEKQQLNKADHDEIDLGFIFQKIGQFFKGILIGFLKTIAFFYRKKWILLGLLILGGVLGYFWEKNSKDKFKTNFIVSASFESVDYLNNKAEAIASKIKLKDSIYLKEVFGENYRRVKNIEVEPFTDVYEFFDRENTKRFEIFELLSEDKNISEFIKEPVNSKNYPYHNIDLIIAGNDDELHKDISHHFFSYINSNRYFNNTKDISVTNDLLQIEQNKVIRKQIDAVIASIVQDQSSELSQPMVSIQESQVDELLERKDLTLNQDKVLKTRVKNQQEVIQRVDANYQVEYEETLLEKDKMFLLPLIFILLYSIVYLLRYLTLKSKAFLAKHDH